MKLFHRELGGEGRPIVILHGLFGSSRNWVAAGRALGRYGRVLALDLRNHGNSGHAPTHSLADLVGDLEEWIEANLDVNPVLLGHSMGGLAVMACALQAPARVRALIVVDMAPRAYPSEHERELEALRLDVSGFMSRRQVDQAMEPLVPDLQIRQFLQMNLEHEGRGYRWTLNVDALGRSTVLQDFAGVEGVYPGDALFVAGGLSNRIREEDMPSIRRRFPAARVERIPGADHWPHHTTAGEFTRIVGGFLSGLEEENPW